MELQELDNEKLMQAYSNACAQLGNTQTLIQELSLRMESLKRDIDKLSEKYKSEVSQSMSLRKEIEKRELYARENK